MLSGLKDLLAIVGLEVMTESVDIRRAGKRAFVYGTHFQPSLKQRSVTNQ